MFKLALLLFWPILQFQMQQQQTQIPQQVAPYRELSIRWDAVGTIESGLDHPLAVLICPTESPVGGNLIVVDSSGLIAEIRYGVLGWVPVRTFAVGEAVTAACAGAPHLDRVWRVYVGTASGKVLEFSRGSVGWMRAEIREVPAPIVNMQASDPGREGISQLFVIDGNGRVFNFWVSEEDEWIPRLFPEIDGGATEVCFDYHRMGLRSMLAGPKGVIYKFVQDSVGRWSGEPWATMPAGVLDMAGSADPTMQDVALFYSGVDGVFRYLFHNFKVDEKARVPIAAGVTHIIGKGDQRRFNEFFAMSVDEFCLFEFNYDTRRWDKIVMKTISSPVVSTAFGPGRGETLHQVYAVSADGMIHEFVRQELEQE